MYRAGLIALLLIVYSSNYLYSQSSQIRRLYQQADSLYNLDDPTEATDKKALSHFDRIIQYYRSQQVVDTILADVFLKKANLHLIAGEDAAVLSNYHQSRLTLDQVRAPMDSVYLDIYTYIGDFHYIHEQQDSAEFYYSKARLVASHWEDALEETPRLYNSFGMMYLAEGDYRQAQNFFRKALRIYEKRFSNDIESQVYVKNNLAWASSRSNEFRSAIEEYQDLLQYQVASPVILGNLGWNYYQIGAYDSAVFYLQQAIHQSHREEVKVVDINNLGKIFLQTDVDSAFHYFRQALEIGEEVLTEKSSQKADSWLGMAQAYRQRDQWDSALVSVQQALVSLIYHYEDSLISGNPDESAQTVSLLELFDVLQEKGTMLGEYYKQTQDDAQLKLALRTFQTAIGVAKHIQKSYDSDDAKLFFVNRIHPVFEKTLEVVYQLYQLTDDPQYVQQGIQVAEASKAAVLAEVLKDVEIKSSGLVNDSLLVRERQLKREITRLRVSMEEPSDSAIMTRDQQQLIDLEIDLARTLNSLQKDPKYYELKYQQDSLSIQAIQEQVVEDDNAVIEYLQGDEALYAFLITKDELHFEKMPLKQDYHESLSQMQQALFDFQPGKYGTDVGYRGVLYNYLIRPFEDAIADKEHLIIVPDGQLSYLPFDILSGSEKENYFLIQDYSLSYSYALHLLLDAIEDRPQKKEHQLLAMAPFVGVAKNSVRGSGFDTLAASGEEVSCLGGSVFQGNDATKSRFLRMAGKYNILHLATHAIVNSEQPLNSYIAFYPGEKGDGKRDSVNMLESDVELGMPTSADMGYRLYTQELYNIRLDSARLVVLSACETGSGQLVHGEGIMSLARAFTYAGCPNIVTTLWKADDQASATIARRLHHYLKEGYAKDEALRFAKLDYLQSDIHPLLKEPYYWANFIFIGDALPVYSRNLAIWWWVAGAFVILMLLGIYLIRYRR